MSKAKQRLDFLIDTGLAVVRIDWDLKAQWLIHIVGATALIAETPYEVIDMAMGEWKK